MKNRPTREQLNLADAIRAVTDVGNYELAIEFIAESADRICLRCGTAFGYTRIPVTITRTDGPPFCGFMHYSCARSAARGQLGARWTRRPKPGRLTLSSNQRGL